MHAFKFLKTAIVMTFTVMNAVGFAQSASSTVKKNAVPSATPAPVAVENLVDPPPEILGESLSGIKKIYGIVSESGNPKSKDPVSYEFWYISPQTYALRYTKPSLLAGGTISFDGSTFRLVFRDTKSAILLRGLAPDPKLLRNTVLNFGEEVSYAVKDAGAEKSVGINFGNGKVQELSELNIQFEKQFSFPHKLQFQTKATTYKREFTRLDLNPEKSPALPREFIPVEVEPFDWNLAMRNALGPGSRMDVDFWVDNPRVIGDFTMEKGVYQKNSRIGIAMRFNAKDGRYIVMAIHNDRYQSAIPKEIGVPIKASDGVEGQVVPGPPLNIYTFVKNDARYYLIGNASIPELLSFSAKITVKPVVETPPKKTEPGK